MAGASMKDIKLRIRSVESTMQITKAMQLVATSKLRRAKERMEASKPFGVVAREAISAAVARCEDSNIPFLTPREVKRRCYVVVAGERGLAGGYNSNIFKAVDAHAEGADYCVLPVGRKAIDKYQHLKKELLEDIQSRVEGTSVSSCFRMAQAIVDGYQAERFDEVWLVYTDFHTMMDQRVEVEQLLPVVRAHLPEDATPVSTVYEVEPAETLRQVMPDYLAGKLYSAICDSYASEVAMRRNAMDSATKNADAMISDLRLRFNRARQGAITQEITEIVAGAEE
ncbi:MAG: ATP synthase F1 subunit gamma [Clostridiales bacterium]|nr:ATP synthase F1 subunit gamma [Clostridiales bacterium]